MSLVDHVVTGVPDSLESSDVVDVHTGGDDTGPQKRTKERGRHVAESRREDASETSGEVPTQASGPARDTAPANKFDPISIASAALSSGDATRDPEGAHSSGLLSRFRSGSSDDDSGTPLRERVGNLVEKARAVVTPDQGSGEKDPESGASEADDASPPRGHKASPEPTSDEQPAGSDDPGWVFHRRVSDDGFEGWLYHYADGTMVDEAGVVYEYPSHQPDSLAQDPSVESSASDSSADRAGEAPSRVTGAEAEEERGPEPPPSAPTDEAPEQDPAMAPGAGRPAFAEVAQGAQAAEEAEEGPAPESASEQAQGSELPPDAPTEAGAPTAFAEAAHGSQERAAEDQPTGEASAGPGTDQSQRAEEAEGSTEAEEPEAREHEGQGSDKDTAEDESENAEARESSEDQSPPSDEDEAEDKAADKDEAAGEDQGADEDEAAGEDQGESDRDAPIPQVEGAGGPLAAVTETVAGTWLKEKAEGRQAVPPEDSADASADATHEEQAETVYVPGFIEYSPSNLLRYVSGGLFAIASIAAVMTIFYAVQAASTPHFLLGGLFVLISLVAAWVLLSWEPTVVSIREGILEVARGPHGLQVDLRDPRTKVDLGSNVGSPFWRMAVHRAGAEDLTIRAGQVKARQFAAIVQHYLAHPRRKPGDESQD